jgi:hypothetical protein
MPKIRPTKKDGPPKVMPFYAICQYYVPFTMGGSVWQWRRYKVGHAESVTLIQEFQAFVFLDEQSKIWNVHEKTTGGLLGEGDTKEAAVFQANKNIEDTPDLKEQMEKLGDTSRFEEVEYDDARRRINKNARRT